MSEYTKDTDNANEPVRSGVRIQGFFRLNILDHGPNGATKIVGDSGWVENTITNCGYDLYLSQVVAKQAGSAFATYAAIGTGTAPDVTATNLPNELTDSANCRCTLSSSTTGSKTAQFTFNLASNVVTANRTIQNVGLFAVSTYTNGSIFAGNTYATSSLATNQSVSGTYQIRFT